MENSENGIFFFPSPNDTQPNNKRMNMPFVYNLKCVSWKKKQS